jgi:phenylacetate-CoA ligase
MNVLDWLEIVAKGRVCFLATNALMNRPGIRREFHRLQRTQHFTADQLRDLQLKRLKAAIKRLGDEVPYYQRIFRSIDFSPQDLRSIEDLKSLPITTRDDIRNYHEEMVVRQFQSAVQFAQASSYTTLKPNPLALFSRHKLLGGQTSGSTGKPLTFYDDGTIATMNWAYEMLLKSWFDIPHGVREARFSRPHVKDAHTYRQSFLRQALWNNMIVPGDPYDRKDQKRLFDQVNRFKPRVWTTIITMLRPFLDYIEEQPSGCPIYKPDLVILVGEMFADRDVDRIRRTLGSKVTSIYSTQELGHIAVQCANEQFHINEESFVVEVEGTQGKSAAGDNITITSLDDCPMPFLRYQPGDLVAMSKEPCACGRPHQVLKKLLGRTSDIHLTRSGRTISPSFWDDFMCERELQYTFKQFQVCYGTEGSFLLRIVPTDSYEKKAELFILENLRKNLGEEASISIELVEFIPPAASGKHQQIVFADR